MLRSHRIPSSSTTEKLLWSSLGVRIGKNPTATTANLVKRQTSSSSPSYDVFSRRPIWKRDLQQCRPFTSSGTTGLIKEQQQSSSIPSPLSSSSETTKTTHHHPTAATALLDEEGNVLGSAAKEAQRLSDLAAKCNSKRGDNKKVISPTTGSSPTTPLVWERAKKNSIVHRDNDDNDNDNNKQKRSNVDAETIQNAVESAQALLFVTRLSSPLQDAIKNRRTAPPDIQKQVSSLHRAFLAVTSWCLDVVVVQQQTMSSSSSSSKKINNNNDGDDRIIDPRMLDMALQVARRAHQLDLPFHIPLYIRLIHAVAEFYDPNNNNIDGNNSNTSSNNNRRRMSAGSLILEIASRATTMLGPSAIESSQFFREPLEALVKRRCYSDVATVLRGIENRSLELDKETLLRLLFTLEITINNNNNNIESTTTSSNSMNNNNYWEEEETAADVLEILNLADPYLWKTITALTSCSDIWNRKQDKDQQRREQLERNIRKIRNNNNNDKRSKSSNDEEQSPTSSSTAGGRLLPTLPSSPNSSSSRRNNTSTRRKKRSTDSYEKKDELYYFRDLIYQTSPPAQQQQQQQQLLLQDDDEEEKDYDEYDVLPDITSQIESLYYKGNDFRYSEDLEREIIKRKTQDIEDEMNDKYHEEYMFSDDLFDDGDDDDFYFELSDGDLTDDDDEDDDDGSSS